jgi:hypothetical protein
MIILVAKIFTKFWWSIMAGIIEIPSELALFQLPVGVQGRLSSLLDRQDAGEQLSSLEWQEAEGLVELVEYLSLLQLRSQRINVGQ